MARLPNDSNHLLAEARLALLVARGSGSPGALTARDALRLATRGGASLLGRDEEIGSLEQGKRADVAVFPVDGLELAGAEADLVAALLFCAPGRVRHLLVEGAPVVQDGLLVGADEQEIAREGRRVGRIILGR
jgi:cytosine/adenosine deaminase-related metal-dependent hydrolase